MMFLASSTTTVIIWIVVLLAMSFINTNKRRKQMQSNGEEESWGKSIFEAMKEASKELSHDDDESAEEKAEREIAQDKQYERAYDVRQKSVADRDDRTDKRLTELDRNGDEESSDHRAILTSSSKPAKRHQKTDSHRREVASRPFSEEYASLSEVAAAQNSSIFGSDSSLKTQGLTNKSVANNSLKTAANTQDAIRDEIAKSEIKENDNRSLLDDFDLRKAVIYSEILRPKFEQNRE